MIRTIIPMAAPARALDTPRVREALMEALARGQYVDGAMLDRFEVEFAAYLGVSHCVGVANGTDALEIALRALRVPAGARVVTVANAGFYASTAIRAIGAEPLYVDVDPETMLMAVPSLTAALHQQPAAVILTHLYGDTSAGPAVSELCRSAGVPLLVDCAQATGRGVIPDGAIGAFSFYPTKNLPCAGDGGAIACDDPEVARRARQVSRYGWAARFTVSEPGRNSRLDDLQAAVLSAGLPALDERNRRRRAIRRQYVEAVDGSVWRSVGTTSSHHVAHLAVVHGPDAAVLRARLADRGVSSDVYFPIPDHRQPAMAHQDVRLPVTESLQGHHLALPCFPELRDDEVERVTAVLGEACHG